jgi:hypothetical protein
MDWLTRNRYWLIGGLVAAGLLGFSGYYLYSNLQRERAIDEELVRQLQAWTELETAKPHPDDASIKAAKEDLARVKDLLEAYEKSFAPFEVSKPADSLDFKKNLETTVDQLRRQAKESDVLLQTNYYFSFEAQRLPTQYDPASLLPLSQRLAEVAALCQVLFKAKVKTIESIQRVSVGRDDTVQSDLVTGVNEITNSIAVVTPYQVTFVAFTAQFADVINGFARSPHCFLIKSLNVTTNAPITGKPPGTPESTTPETPGYIGPPTPGIPGAEPPSLTYFERMRRRYGPGYRLPGMGPGGPGQAGPYGPQYPPPGGPGYGPGVYPGMPGMPPPPAHRHGPETVLEEVPLRAVMQIDVVKVLPPSERGKYKPPAARKKTEDTGEPASDETTGQTSSDTSAN